MDRDKAVEMLRTEKVQQWNKHRDTHRNWRPDLKGVDLAHRDLRRVNLSNASLDHANLSRTTFSSADLSHVRLSHADLSDANLQGAKLVEADLGIAVLSGTRLMEADLTDANLEGAVLVDANLEGAILYRAKLDEADLFGARLDGTDLSNADLRNANVAGISYDRRRMRGKYAGVNAALCFGNALFRRDAQDQDYIDTLEDTWTRAWQTKRTVRAGLWRTWLFFWRYAMDYGRGLGRVAIGAIAFALFFGAVYWISEMAGTPMLYSDPTRVPDWWFTSFYYSIVTYTTLGFGDVTPQSGTGQLLVTIEVILGYITLGMLVAILAQKVARRAH